MTTLTLESLIVLGTNGLYGTITVLVGQQKLLIQLTDEQAADFQAQALSIFQSQQRALADEIASAQPKLLCAPEADYTEVPF